MNPKLTDAQRDVLLLISAAGTLDSRATNPQRLSARTLAARGLPTVKGHGSAWTATITETGRYFVENDEYPPGHPRAPRPRRSEPARRGGRTDAGNDDGR